MGGVVRQPLHALQALRRIDFERDAPQEKIYVAERRVAFVRLAVLAVTTGTYFTVAGGPDSLRWLALLVLAIAWPYTAVVLAFEPYRRFAFLVDSYFTSVADGVLISLWLAGTGGFNSPYYVLWYVSVAAVALRYDYLRTMVASILYAVSYLAILTLFGQTPADVGGMVVRIAFIFLVGVVGDEAARESSKQGRAKRQSEALADLLRIGATEADTERVLALVTERARELLGADFSTVALVDAGGRVTRRGTHGSRSGAWQTTVTEVPPGSGLAAAMQTGKTVVVERIGENADFPIETLPVQRAEGIRTSLTAPLFGRTGVRGAINVGWRSDMHVGPDQVRLADTLAGYVATILDNAQAHEELARRAEELQAIIEQVPAGLVIFDAHGRRVLSNATVLSARSVVSDPTIPITEPDPVIVRREPGSGRVLQPDETPGARALRGETVGNFEYEFWRPDAVEPEVVQASARPLRDRHGAITGALAVYNSVTEQRKLERQVRQSEERFRALTEHASDLIVLQDTEGVILYASPSAERLLGQTLINSARSEFRDHIHPEDLDGLQKAYGDVRPHPGSCVRCVFRCRAADGTWLWLEGIITNMLDMPSVGGILMNARDISDGKRAEEALRQQALHDALTGLPNRTLLLDRLDQALLAAAREGRAVAVLAIDLDRFKEVNDTFGHHCGDALLQQLGARLQAVLRKSDTIARMGGDEFTVLLTAFRDATEVIGVVEKLLAALERPFVVEGRRVNIGASIGVVLYPEHAEDSDTLLRWADVAMYAAKRAGGGYQVYAPERDERTVARMAARVPLI
ncbi:MAG TPA: diguanylate cyclase [Chloroflexota bacterium]|nr:diguanylate cyclase [Chloroflexota bacterium]